MTPKPPFEVRYADTSADAIAIFNFVATVSGPRRFCDINPKKASREIERVVKDKSYGFALMAEHPENKELLGTMGIIMPTWWYGDDYFATDRWFFIIPILAHMGIGTGLLAEAAAMAKRMEIPLIVNGKPRARNQRSGTVFFNTETLFEDQEKD